MDENDRDAYADRLAAVAAQFVARVRDEDPQANSRWLYATLPDPADREALLYVLAAAVPVDRSWRSLTAWIAEPAPLTRLRPHGTYAAAQRHRYHREPLCGPCREAEREMWRERKRALRKKRAA